MSIEGKLGEEQAKKLAEQCKLDYFDLKEYKVPEEVRGLVPAELVRDYRIIPYSVKGRIFTLVTSNLGMEGVDAIGHVTGDSGEGVGYEFVVGISSDEAINKLIEKYF